MDKNKVQETKVQDKQKPDLPTPVRSNIVSICTSAESAAQITKSVFYNELAGKL